MKNELKLSNLSISFYCFLLVVFVSLLYLCFHIFNNNNIVNNQLSLFTVSFFLLLFFCTLLFTKLPLHIKWITYVLFTIKVLIIYAYSQSNTLLLFNDSRNYIQTLDYIIKTGDFFVSNIQFAAGSLHVGHYYFMLLPYLIFKSELAVVLFNLFLTSISLILFYKSFEIDFAKKIAIPIFIFTSFSANIFLFGSGILKDSIVLFITALIVYGAKTKRIKFFIIITLTIFLFTVRIYAGFSMLMYLIYTLVAQENKLNSKKKKYGAIIFLIISLIIISITSFGKLYLTLSLSYVTNLLSFNTLILIPKTLLKFYYSPLPWNSLNDISTYSILSIDTTIFIFFSLGIVLFIIKYLKYKELRLKTNGFLIAILIHAIVLGYAYDGDSARQRIGIFVFLALIITLGFLYKKNKKALE